MGAWYGVLAFCRHTGILDTLPEIPISGRTPTQTSGTGAGHAQRAEKFSAVQMIDVRIPTSDGRELALTR